MKIKITRKTHGFKPGTVHTVTAGRGANMIAGNFAVEEGKNSLAVSTLATLNKRQLLGLAIGRSVAGCRTMQPGQLIAAMASDVQKPAVKKTVKKKATSKKGK